MNKLLEAPPLPLKNEVHAKVPLDAGLRGAWSTWVYWVCSRLGVWAERAQGEEDEEQQFCTQCNFLNW